MKRMTLILFLLLSVGSSSLFVSCASQGEKAAKEVIYHYKKGHWEQFDSALRKYSDTLDGQDLIDFCNELEKEGVM